MEIKDRIKANIISYELIERGDTVIVGASGGPDSQFLSYILASLKDELGFDLVLAHLNHLHRKEAKADEDLVRKTAKKLGLEFFVRSRSMDDYAKKLGTSSEDAGRRLRYEFFRELGKSFKSPKIAVAHTRDDQAETILMRIIRGTGLDGLRAMDYKNKDIIRPILNIKKEDLIAYLEQNKIPYAVDHTNFESDYTRNKIRLDIIPEIEKINPGFIDQAFRLTEIAKDDLGVLDSYIENIFSKLALVKDRGIYFKRKDFEDLDEGVLKRLLRKSIEVLKGELRDMSKENIDDFVAIRDLDTGKVLIKDDLILRKSYDYYALSLYEEFEPDQGTYELKSEDEISLNGYRLKTSIVGDRTFTRDNNIAYLDYEKLSLPLKIRTRKNGDRFTPLGRESEVKLKDFFQKQKIDRLKRDLIPLVLSGEKIVYIPGLRISDDFKVESTSKKILKIEVYNEN